MQRHQRRENAVPKGIQSHRKPSLKLQLRPRIPRPK